jgi:hypothetical protein
MNSHNDKREQSLLPPQAPPVARKPLTASNEGVNGRLALDSAVDACRVRPVPPCELLGTC